MFLSFVFYKIMKWFMKKPTKTTESFNLNTKYRYDKMIAEVNMLNKCLYDSIMESALYESDQKAVAKIEATAEKSEGICKRMFNWIKEKFKSAIDWVKKHPWITLAIIVLIGFVFYYRNQISTLESLNKLQQEETDKLMKQASARISDLETTNSDLYEKLANQARKLEAARQNLSVRQMADKIKAATSDTKEQAWLIDKVSKTPQAAQKLRIALGWM